MNPIQTIREARELFERLNDDSNYDHGGCFQHWSEYDLPKLIAALAELEKQKPVLFIHPKTFAMDSGHVGAWKPGHELKGYIPLYAAPVAKQPQAEAVGCDYCSHPLYAGIKCPSCGRDSQQPQAEAVPLQVFESSRAKTLMKAWQEGFRAGDSWRSSVALFWQDNDYGNPPKEPVNPYAAAPQPKEQSNGQQ